MICIRAKNNLILQNILSREIILATNVDQMADHCFSQNVGKLQTPRNAVELNIYRFSDSA